MTTRKQRKALARSENDTREWAHQAARNLALSMVAGQPTPGTPYGVGVVLDPGEQVWAECPIRFLQEVLPQTDRPARLSDPGWSLPTGSSPASATTGCVGGDGSTCEAVESI